MLRLVLLSLFVTDTTSLAYQRRDDVTTINTFMFDDDFITDHWEDFYINHCGSVCVNGSVRFLPGHSGCYEPECFDCDCEPSCSLLGTCCPNVYLHSNGSYTRLEDLPKEQTPPFPHQVQCGKIPYHYGHFLLVSSCPTGFDTYDIPKGLIQTIRGSSYENLCTKNASESEDLDDILPFVDMESGLVFKNKFCALCNGYDIMSTNASVEEEDRSMSESETRKVIPWQIEVKCDHYQNLFNITSLREFVDTAWISNPLCNVEYQYLDVSRQPNLCSYNQPENLDSLNCSDSYAKLCRDLDGAYVSLEGHQNLFCYVCKGLELKQGFCFYPVDSEVFSNRDAVSIFGDDVEWGRSPPRWTPPISLLLGVGGTRMSGVDSHKDCITHGKWLDEDVSRPEIRIKTHGFKHD